MSLVYDSKEGHLCENISQYYSRFIRASKSNFTSKSLHLSLHLILSHCITPSYIDATFNILTLTADGYTTEQISSLSRDTTDDKGVDGSIHTYAHTKKQLDPWWIVDLTKNYKVKKIKVLSSTSKAGMFSLNIIKSKLFNILTKYEDGYYTRKIEEKSCNRLIRLVHVIAFSFLFF